MCESTAGNFRRTGARPEVATEKPKYTVNKGKDMSSTEYELVAL